MFREFVKDWIREKVVIVAEIKYGGTFSSAHKWSIVKIKPVNCEFNWIKIPYANKKSYPTVYRIYIFTTPNY